MGLVIGLKLMPFNGPQLVFAAERIKQCLVSVTDGHLAHICDNRDLVLWKS